MPPDEYHWPVNDSVYTNQVAKISLLTANKVNAQNQIFKDIAENMFIPFNQSGQWHPEYVGYSEGKTVIYLFTTNNLYHFFSVLSKI